MHTVLYIPSIYLQVMSIHLPSKTSTTVIKWTTLAMVNPFSFNWSSKEKPCVSCRYRCMHTSFGVDPLPHLPLSRSHPKEGEEWLQAEKIQARRPESEQGRLTPLQGVQGSPSHGHCQWSTARHHSGKCRDVHVTMYTRVSSQSKLKLIVRRWLNWYCTCMFL